jgi:hypothetical protein
MVPMQPATAGGTRVTFQHNAGPLGPSLPQGVHPAQPVLSSPWAEPPAANEYERAEPAQVEMVSRTAGRTNPPCDVTAPSTTTAPSWLVGLESPSAAMRSRRTSALCSPDCTMHTAHTLSVVHSLAAPSYRTEHRTGVRCGSIVMSDAQRRASTATSASNPKRDGCRRTPGSHPGAAIASEAIEGSPMRCADAPSIDDVATGNLRELGTGEWTLGDRVLGLRDMLARFGDVVEPGGAA